MKTLDMTGFAGGGQLSCSTLTLECQEAREMTGYESEPDLGKSLEKSLSTRNRTSTKNIETFLKTKVFYGLTNANDKRKTKIKHPAPRTVPNDTVTSVLKRVIMKNSIENGGCMKKAFTLAEVLITLGIIGIVAAMTMPALIQNYKKKEIISKLKKAYAVTANAIKMSEVEHGEFKHWQIPETASEYAEKYFLPYFNSAKICKTYRECGYKSDRPLKMINGSAQGMLVAHEQFRVPLIMNDGTYVWFSIMQGAFDSNENYKSSGVTFDINGAKEPNTYGKDIFCFKITNKGLEPLCLEENGVDSCSIESTGGTCACRIIENGWEFPDNYPVKI